METSAQQSLIQMPEQAMRVMLALNYCHTALAKILTFKDRIILDEGYHNIINNIRLSAIDDEEIIAILQKLMDTLTTFKLAEGERELVINEYDMRVRQAFYATLLQQIDPNEFIIVNPLNAAKGVVVVGSTYQNYLMNMATYRANLDQSLWELGKESIQTINEARKLFLEVSWKLMKQYDIPDKWRLTEKQLNKILSIFQEPNCEKRYRQLMHEQEYFLAFPPFWYTLAQTSQEVGDLQQAFTIYEQISTRHIGFFREDHDFSSALMNKILLIQTVQATQPSLLKELDIREDISQDLNRITQNSPDDWRKTLFVALQYLQLQEYERARQLIMKNIDNGKEVVLHSRVLGDIYALSKDERKLAALLEHMVQEDHTRYQDVFYLAGQFQDTQLSQTAIESFLSPVLAPIEFTVRPRLFVGKDSLAITIPTTWMKADPEHFTLKVSIPGKEEDSFAEDNVDIDEKTQTATFYIKGVLDANDFIKQRKELTLAIHLTDSNQLIAFFVDVCVQDMAVEEGLLEKSLQVFDKTKDAVEVAATFYKDKLFKPRANQDDETASEQETQAALPQKTVPVIQFTLRKITTPEIGYAVNGSVLEKIS